MGIGVVLDGEGEGEGVVAPVGAAVVVAAAVVVGFTGGTEMGWPT